MITTAFFGFIVYIIFRLYEDSKNRDYSIKKRVIERQYYKEKPINPWEIKTKYPQEIKQNNPWNISDRNRWKKPENVIGERWTVDFLKCLEWKRYEDICMEYLRIKNCNAFVTCTGADGGIDIKVKDSKGTTFVIGQCKSWKRQIGVNLIRELYGVMAAEKAKHGVFLTTSTYSVEAQIFAKDKHLMLIDAEELVRLINNLNENERRRIDKIATAGDYTTPTCVQCNEKMVKRVAKSGANKGGEFWGCINYPKCRITMKVR
ncbi:restriction endonuclease [Methylomonas methanica]|nr:restriction endonuclease [Methylomonas methanica]